MQHILLAINGVSIRKDERNFICLNDLWYAAEKPGNKNPRKWRGFVQAKEIINHYQTEGTVLIKDGLISGTARNKDGSVIYSIGGAGGGTFAIREIALAYAGYLDVHLQALIYQAFLDRVDGVQGSTGMPAPLLPTFSGSSKAQRKKIVPVTEDQDASYWKGYAAALEKMVIRLSGKEVAL